jgi:hypothetical protein
MAFGVLIRGKTKRGLGRGLLAWAPLAFLIPAASCVPATLASPADVTLTRADIQAFTAPSALAAADSNAPGLSFLVGDQAFVANAAIPLAGGPNPAAGSFVFSARTPLDQMRSIDCLAQAVYYEARSEGEAGERAVAQVVLNRVRHPAWPNSVCGVVYQGPMGAGGGCQFTFTCDGSLGSRPYGPGWTEAQRIAMEALGGRTFAPVGLSTHYHTSAVFPSWAPRLTKTAVIGAHIFYRLPGLAGSQDAFSDAYAGSEPLPRPAMTMPARQAAASAFQAMANESVRLDPGTGTRVHAASAPPPSDIAQDARWTASNLPQSDVREEHQQSGQWRDDAPAAVTGR